MVIAFLHNTNAGLLFDSLIFASVKIEHLLEHKTLSAFRIFFFFFFGVAFRIF